MAKRILIVDDDKEFSVLLTDVYEQADYIVSTAASVDEACALMEARTMDLVVTDFRMPEKSGLELIDELSRVAPEVPVVMVSGYLENTVIRDLIGRGVGGIFMKPLNIFSLLKKTGELITHAEKAKMGLLEGGRSRQGFDASLPFPFRSLPCKDNRSREFARRLFELRDFSKNLLLIANPGMPLETLCEDLVGMGERKDMAILLEPARVTREALFDELEKAIEEGAEQITFVFSETASLGPEQCEIIYQLARQKGPFVALTLPKRFIFFLREDLNHYYDAGLIDEEFYIFLGSTEVKVPELAEIPEDIPLIADVLLEEHAPEKRFEPAARAALARREWPGHITELRKAIEAAAMWSDGELVTTDDVRAVITEGDSDGGADGLLATHLRLRKAEYEKALSMISPFVVSDLSEEGATT